MSPALSGSAQCRGYGMASGLFGGTNPPRGERLLRKSARERRVRKGESHMREETSVKRHRSRPNKLLSQPPCAGTSTRALSPIGGGVRSPQRLAPPRPSVCWRPRLRSRQFWALLPQRQLRRSLAMLGLLTRRQAKPRRQTILPASSHPQTMARMFEAWGRSRLPSLIPWGRICSLRWNPLRPSRLLRPTSRREEQDESADCSGDDDATRKDAANELNGEVLTSTGNGAAVQVGAGESLAVQGSTIIALATTGSSALSVSDGGVADVAAASTLSARGENSTALACTGTGSVACLSDSSAYAPGEKCAAIAASDGAIVSMERGSLEATLGAVVRAEGPAATSLSSTHRFS